MLAQLLSAPHAVLEAHTISAFPPVWVKLSLFRKTQTALFSPFQWVSEKFQILEDRHFEHIGQQGVQVKAPGSPVPIPHNLAGGASGGLVFRITT